MIKRTNIFAAALCMSLALSMTFGTSAYAYSGLDSRVGSAGTYSFTDMLDDLAEACQAQAACETDLKQSVVMVNSETNPYDVEYDYGEAYEHYVDICDWSLVFDIDYYKKTFPMLALQYHDDEDLLLRHFQTVGIHEGRQGCKDFNVGAYMDNCSSSYSDIFGENYAAYYMFYMIAYNSQKSVDTVNRADGNEKLTQYATVMTAYQAKELDDVNKYRKNVDADPVEFDSELAAFAAYRGYLNAHDGWKGHDWLKKHDASGDGFALKLLEPVFDNSRNHALAENTITDRSKTNSMYKHIAAIDYRNSPEHYAAMVNTKYSIIGISNMTWNDDETNCHSQFDVFTNSNIDTPTHPEK